MLWRTKFTKYLNRRTVLYSQFSIFPLLIWSTLALVIIVNLISYATSLVQSNTEEFGDSSNTGAIIKELRAEKEAEILRSLKHQLEADNTEKFRREIMAGLEEEKAKYINDFKKDINDNYRDTFIASLKQEIDEQYTEQFKETSEFTYSLFETLSSKFLKDNYKKIKEYTIFQMINNLISSDLQFPPTFETQLQDKISSYLDMNEYYNNILKNILLANTVKVDEASQKEALFLKKLKPLPINNGKGYTREELLAYQVPDRTLQLLKKSYNAVLKLIKHLEPPPTHFVNGHGIVIFFDDYGSISSSVNQKIALLLLSIVQIKNLGSTLPMEIIFMKNYSFIRYLIYFFNSYFKMTIKVTIVSDIIDTDLFPSRFPRKLLALLVSSFDHIIYLDVGVIPVKNLDSLLFTDPYINSKFLVWPHQLYQRQISPIFWEDLLGIVPGEPIRRYGIPNDADNLGSKISYYDLQYLPDGLSTDSSLLVFSKRSHFKSLLLSIYLNLMGNEFTYPLLYQGLSSGGDRETFVPSLIALEEVYFQVQQESLPIKDISDSETSGVLPIAYLQVDPRDDYNYMMKWRMFLKNKGGIDSRLNPFESTPFTEALEQEFLKHIEKPSILTYNFHSKFKPLLTSSTLNSRILEVPDSKLVTRFRDPILGTSLADHELRFSYLLKWIFCDSQLSGIPTFWEDELIDLDQKFVCQNHQQQVNLLQAKTEDTKYSILHFLK
ncbi:mannosyltransferase putative-domain-containing protein [Scheffersomyces amazonensis]|uniref:mannosyltransferase putative-domain-containing protein n=1 Tax=Scheffersomyces amazonensis TaxID=1078765 RepID=UPI00315DC363